MGLERFIITKGVLTDDNQIIPIWDSRVKFENRDDYGNFLRLTDESTYTIRQPVDCIFDIKHKKLSMGIEGNKYPDETKMMFKKGDEVYFEYEFRTLKEGKIVDILYEDFTPIIIRGSKMDKYYYSLFKEVIPSLLYVIKIWEPIFLMDDGTRIEYEHLLYKKQPK